MAESESTAKMTESPPLVTARLAGRRPLYLQRLMKVKLQGTAMDRQEDEWGVCRQYVKQYYKINCTA